MADLFEPKINPCRCGSIPKVSLAADHWFIECGNSLHFYGLSRTTRADAIRDWNASMPSKPRGGID